VDPVTHALLGAAAARVVAGRRLGNAALLPGAVGALLPDLDALIRSASDPLLYAEFHRHFTHSLAFIPIGGAIASLPWTARKNRPRPERLAYLAAAVAGIATHGLLDASTTYGTRLAWPFSSARFGWSFISIVDPIFTLVLLVGVLLTLRRGSSAPAAAALAAAVLYLGLGAAQRSRVLDVQEAVALARSHRTERRIAVPTFANQIVWRSIYQAGDTIYFDRVRTPWIGRSTWYAESEAPLLREADLGPVVRARPELVRDFHRFRHFAGGWLAADPGDPSVIGDARYSRLDDEYQPVWGIRLDPRPPGRTEWVDRSRQRELDTGRLWREIRGTAGTFEALPERP
jgi:inner membrane protein